jgi:hypothetical protein
MRISHIVVAFLCAVGLAACGGPKAGDSCDAEGFLCADQTTALECRTGTWRALPCRGPAGCTVSNSRVSCDMSKNVAGDACAASTEGQGLCNATNNGTLVCRQGTIVAQDTCTSCTVSGDQVICTK